MNKTIKFNCPYCNEDLTFEINDNEVKVYKSNVELSEDELSQVLKESNIEFG